MTVIPPADAAARVDVAQIADTDFRHTPAVGQLFGDVGGAVWVVVAGHHQTGQPTAQPSRSHRPSRRGRVRSMTRPRYALQLALTRLPRCSASAARLSCRCLARSQTAWLLPSIISVRLSGQMRRMRGLSKHEVIRNLTLQRDNVYVAKRLTAWADGAGDSAAQRVISVLIM